MRRRILVTGAAGTIGTIVAEDLSGDDDLTLVHYRDVPRPHFVLLNVATDYEGLKGLMPGHDTVLHLALSKDIETGCANEAMAKNVYRAAMEMTPHPRVIVAGSIHAVGGWVNWDEEPYSRIARRDPAVLDAMPLITTDRVPRPNGVYGAQKVYMEALGAYYASRGLQVVVIRFGGVRADDHIPDEVGYHAHYLSRRDCGDVIRRAIQADLLEPFAVCFAVSANRFRFHDLTPAKRLLGWEPRDSFESRNSPGNGFADRPGGY